MVRRDDDSWLDLDGVLLFVVIAVIVSTRSFSVLDSMTAPISTSALLTGRLATLLTADTAVSAFTILVLVKLVRSLAAAGDGEEKPSASSSQP
jgi:uncharacterized membrane-anchored protein